MTGNYQDNYYAKAQTVYNRLTGFDPKKLNLV